MTKKNKKRYDQLIKLQEHLMSQIEYLSDGILGNINQTGQDSADLSSISYNKTVNIQLLTGEEKELLLVNEALDRIKDGTYGTCIDCEQEISKGRLDAIPFAKLCISHKEEREKQKLDYGFNPNQDSLTE